MNKKHSYFNLLMFIDVFNQGIGSGVGLRFMLILLCLLTGCSSRQVSVPPGRELTDSIAVIVQLDKQLNDWKGTPYRDGGLAHSGIDCSGFVYRTFRDHFNIQLPRTTEQQTMLGTQVDRHELMPGDLVFFKTGRGVNGLHVGIYDTDGQFIHASTKVGVTRSSLDNIYWRRVYWQARRL